MRAGSLDRRITIQSKSVTQSDSGQEAVSWSDVATVWARKVENRGDERFAQQQITGRAPKTFQVRWSDTVKVVTNEHRIMFDGRAYNITDVRELGRREGLEIDAYAPGEEPVDS